jgi:hypothetical protein
MEPAIILDLLILLGIVGLWVFIWIERNRKQDSFGQLDEAFGRVAVELLERTKHLPDLADLMPNISLVNDPLGGAIRAVWDKMMGTTSPEDNFTGFTQPAPADDERRMMMYGDSETESSSEEGTSSGPTSE